MAGGYILGHGAATAETLLKRDPGPAHMGLAFDRFLAMWDGPVGGPRPVKPISGPLKAFVNQFHQGEQSQEKYDLLKTHHERLDAACGSSRALDARDLAVQWRFATGLGGAHPTENGFSFDDLIGVPCVTGSSIKGLCRAAAEALEADVYKIETLLGPDTEAAFACGDLVFFDALPNAWPTLIVDIVNCHHPDYYRRNIEHAVETEDPVPVFFLAVDQGSSFRFRIGSRSQDKDNVEQGWKWLKEGLDCLGIGAKTAVGYGQMGKPTEGKKKSVNVHPWLIEQIPTLMKRHNISREEEVWGGKTLALAWRAITNPAVKTAVRGDIRAHWQAAGWDWDKPPKGAKRKAREIYGNGA